MGRNPSVVALELPHINSARATTLLTKIEYFSIDNTDIEHNVRTRGKYIYLASRKIPRGA